MSASLKSLALVKKTHTKVKVHAHELLVQWMMCSG